MIEFKTSFSRVTSLVLVLLLLSCGIQPSLQQLTSTHEEKESNHDPRQQKEAICKDDLYKDTCKASFSEFPTIVYKGETIYVQDDLFQVYEPPASITSNEEEKESTKVALNHEIISTATIKEGEKVNLKYVKSFLSENETSSVMNFCNQRNGWTASRQNKDGDGNQVGVARTSNSCPLLWPLLYLPKIQQLKAANRLTPELEHELYFTWDLMQRIADYLQAPVENIEPLQLVRYTPGQFYKQHHDHGGYYGASSEQRPITMLLFLSTMPESDGGGHTLFSNLDLAVLPRKGDGIIWSNVDDNGELLVDALHEAVPPKGNAGNVVKYAMNVWVSDKPIMGNIDASAYRTQ